MRKLTVCLLMATGLLAQPEKTRPVFEVVSIKPHKSGDDRTMMPFGIVNGRYAASNIRLRQLITAAYVDSEVPFQADIEIAGLPRWAATDGFDIQAQTETGFTPTKQQTMKMLQRLLEDRFKLRIRREPKNAPIYALVIDSGGLKLNETQTLAGPTGGPPSVPPGQMHIRALSLPMLISVLGPSAGRKVVDKTGLTGQYQIDLKFAPDPSRLPPGIEPDPNLPSLFTALREQLGLRLVPETGTVDTFVVESVEKPSEN